MTALVELPKAGLVAELEWTLAQARAPRTRSMADWVEEEIVLPSGPFADERYKHHRHPVSKIWFDEVDSGRWNRFAATGPTQNGKTLMCHAAPVLYHLFEIKETCILGLPTLDMANDKWEQDFKPVIEASRYRDLLPSSGEGSRGGQVKRSIKFRNGAALRFMTAGGNDKKRAGYTSRVLSVTEVDGMDEASETSREADKIEQLEGRTRAFGRTGKRVYLECTLSIEKGKINQEIQNGSASVLVRPCPHCDEWVAPEREHLVGWQEAESEMEAAEKAHFICPACSAPWTDEERIAAAKDLVLLHRGQVMKDGKAEGPLPKTQTLGFRWSAIDNPFASAADLGAEEYLASKDRDHENAEKKMRQFVWSMPYDPPDIELTPLDPDNVEKRTTDLKKGVLPEDTLAIAVGVDTGKYALHWTCIALTAEGGRIIEYGKQPVDSNRLGIKRALKAALKELADYFLRGWSTPSGQRMMPGQVWIDSGWYQHTDAVYAFCAEINREMELEAGSELFRPMKGYGEGQRNMTRYIAPSKAKDRGILYVGNEFHIAKVRRNGRILRGVMLVHVNSDNWKSELHQRLLMDETEPLALTLYDVSSFAEHAVFTQHITAETQVEKFIPERGKVIVWERLSRTNHWLDSSYVAVCAGEAILTFKLEVKKAEPPRSLKQMAGKK